MDVATGINLKDSDKDIFQNKMEELQKRVSTELTEQQQREVLNIFTKWSQAWLKPRSGQCKAIIADFIVSGRPCRDKLRPLSAKLKEELNKQLDSMLAAGVIQTSKSEWGSVPVFVKKPDGSWRMAVDYRAVNKQIKFDAYPLPLIWDNLQSAAGYCYYTCLDGMWGFWNIPLSPQNKKVTALLTHRGSFEFNVLPFGIKNSPTEFQRAMDAMFGDLCHKGVLCYIDDIVIY
eukprot:Lankesteria_metandrocarpae@DN6986_c0_g1_i1.p1